MKNYEKHFDECIFAFDGKDNIMESHNLGICSDISSLLTPDTSVSAMKSMQGCPYTNTALDFDVRFRGERVKASAFKWLPNAILREGELADVAISTVTALIPAMRTAIQKITLKNKTDSDLSVPITLSYMGKTRYESIWQFLPPSAGFQFPRHSPMTLGRENYDYDGRILSLVKDSCAYRVTTSLENPHFFNRAYLLEGKITLAPQEEKSFYISLHIGEEKESLAEAEKTLGHYEELIESSFAYLLREVARIHDNLPRLTSDSEGLDKLYYRSLVTYILCRWENPSLCAMPFFSTGSVNGSCMCSYLWDYCGGLMMHPIYDEAGNKVQLKAYLKNDLTKSYALNPVTAEGVGPWYQINQEKIICMVYYHVLATGDRDFLFEQVGDKTVLEWMRYYAYVCDDVEKEVALYDYGEGGNDHLEIAAWENGPYNGIIPDLNARRYMNYMRVYELTKVAGSPDELLPKRAAALKEKLKELWNEDAKWYDFIGIDGKRDTRYTIQMFKFIASDVIDGHERDGLVSHINEEEFLSEYGMHSMSKLDPQYDQWDIDNGGGGTCTHFVMQTCAQLYEMGYDTLASDILRRVYWWGSHLPYLGDSCISNMISNNDRTRLQGDISSVSAAQMIFFYIFGIKAEFDGKINISPVKNRPAKQMRIDNARLCGKVFSVDIQGDVFTVFCDGQVLSAKIGETVIL